MDGRIPRRSEAVVESPPGSVVIVRPWHFNTMLVNETRGSVNDRAEQPFP
jgi:hypothetical protein